MIVLDTHVLVWLDQGSTLLGPKARVKLDAAAREGTLAVSAITFWEIGMLIEKGRLRLDMDPQAWRTDLLKSGLTEIPLDGVEAIHGARLKGFHGDPADRLIAATALRHSARLATADERLLAWSGSIQRIDARR